MIDDFQNIIVSDEIQTILKKYNWKRLLKSKNNFIYNRHGEIADYYLNITFNNERLYFECILDIEFPDRKLNDLYLLINHVNEKSYDGYFTFVTDNKTFKYKDSIHLSSNLSNKSLYGLIDLNLSTSDELIQNFTLSIHKLIYSEVTITELTDLMFVKVLGNG